MKREIIAVVTVILVIVIAGLTLHTALGQARAPLAFCVIAAAVITFFWFVSDPLLVSSSSTWDEGTLRKAIAALIVVEYLILVGIVAFWVGGPEQLAPLTQTLLNNFTTVVGVVIAFYFGSSAYLEAKRRTEPKPSMPHEAEKASVAQPPVGADASQAARR